MNFSTAKRATLFFFVALFISFFPRFAGAVNTGTVGILPAYPDPNVYFSDAWFIYNLDKGKEKIDGVRVLNNKEETVVVRLYPVDATNTAEGTFALLPEDAERRGVGDWVRLSVPEIELPPKSEKIVPFSIKIPENADVGDHMGGIIMQEIEAREKQTTGMGIQVITRVGVRIYEKVPGEVKKDFDVTRFDWRFAPSGTKSFIKDLFDINKKTVFLTGIKNKGNVRISPKVTIDVKNIFGMTLVHLPDQEIGEIFPGEESKEGVAIWNKTPIIGRYKVLMTVSFAEEGVGQASRELVIWMIPFRIIFLLVTLIILFSLARLIRLYRREMLKEKMPIYAVKMGDNLADLSHKFSVPWKKIAGFNHIGKPFEIRAGEKLFIPINRKNKEIIERMKNSGELSPSIFERSGASELKKKKFFVVVAVLLLAGAGAMWGIKARNEKRVREVIQVPKPEEAPKQETDEKTISGAVKKSSVNVAVTTPLGADQRSSDKLLKKLVLIGYPARLAAASEEKGYEITTIEYKTGKKEQAKILKNDLGLEDEVDLKEVPDLGSDAVIYNLASPDAFFDLD